MFEKPPRHSLQNIRQTRAGGRQPPKRKGQKNSKKDKKSFGQYAMQGFWVVKRGAITAMQALH